VISITDGQIFLDTDMFNSGTRPAVHAGLSVSRVGGAAQTKVIKKLGGGVRLSLSQYRELAAFSQFASDLDDATRKQLSRGQRVTELMKQKQYSPLSVGQMAVSLFAADRGFLDDVELNKIGAFEAALHDSLGSTQAELMNALDSGDWNDDLEKRLKAAVENFKATGSW
jgi:F-type H+-transporting ATPase subunit alpha